MVASARHKNIDDLLRYLAVGGEDASGSAILRAASAPVHDFAAGLGHLQGTHMVIEYVVNVICCARSGCVLSSFQTQREEQKEVVPVHTLGAPMGLPLGPLLSFGDPCEIAADKGIILP